MLQNSKFPGGLKKRGAALADLTFENTLSRKYWNQIEKNGDTESYE